MRPGLPTPCCLETIADRQRETGQRGVHFRKKFFLQRTGSIAGDRVRLDTELFKPADTTSGADVGLGAVCVTLAEVNIDLAIRIALRTLNVVGLPAVDPINILLVECNGEVHLEPAVGVRVPEPVELLALVSTGAPRNRA